MAFFLQLDVTKIQISEAGEVAPKAEQDFIYVAIC